ncbi:MAG: hypothetical protein M1490_00060 [Candidatus Bathyarchaeota archaeon]|nr:hypothetical protein [Candidatus Bathyarchaeota archaeon]
MSSKFPKQLANKYEEKRQHKHVDELFRKGGQIIELAVTDDQLVVTNKKEYSQQGASSQ